jgi:hypothetical protein
LAAREARFCEPGDAGRGWHGVQRVVAGCLFGQSREGEGLVLAITKNNQIIYTHIMHSPGANGVQAWVTQDMSIYLTINNVQPYIMFDFYI